MTQCGRLDSVAWFGWPTWPLQIHVLYFFLACVSACSQTLLSTQASYDTMLSTVDTLRQLLLLSFLLIKVTTTAAGDQGAW